MFVTRKWPPAMGGMETYSVRLTEELARSCHVHVIALPGNLDGSPPNARKLAGFPVTVLRRWLGRASSPDILHIGDMAIWPIGLLGLLSRKRMSVVLSAHGTDVAYHRRRGVKATLYRAYLKLGSRLLRDARVIANSGATAGVLKETGWTRSDVVPLATDLAAVDSKPSLHSDSILFAGRLVKRKGCSWFIETVLPLLPEQVHLAVAGTIWDESERAALDHPRVRYLGSLDQVSLARAYSEALCVVVPNIPVESGEYEGFGLVAPEVASSGGVLLASKCDGIIDAVIDGETGFLVEPAEPYAWASKINEIREWSADARTEFIKSAQMKADTAFSWRRVADDTTKIYKKSFQ